MTQESDELKAARSAYVEAQIKAEDLERDARHARRKAAARLRHYESLLLEAQGQLPLEEEPT